MCDRDYMYVRGMQSCHGDPASSWWKPLRREGEGEGGGGGVLQVVFPDGNDYAATYLQRGRSVRTYTKKTSVAAPTVRIGSMLYMDDGFFGFLGKNPRAIGKEYKDYPDFEFQQCNTIRQCHPQKFTMYGYTIGRRRVGRVVADILPNTTVVTTTESSDMPLVDPFRCGAYGYEVLLLPPKCLRIPLPELISLTHHIEDQLRSAESSRGYSLLVNPPKLLRTLTALPG